MATVLPHKCVYFCVLCHEFSRPLLSLMIPQKDFLGFVYVVVYIIVIMTMYIVVIMAMIFCMRRIESKISQGKAPWDRIRRQGDISFPDSLLEKSHRRCLIPLLLNCWQHGEVLPHSDSVSKVLIGSFSCRHPFIIHVLKFQIPL